MTSKWNGIRPLIQNSETNTKNIVRGHKILESANGVISIIGGKWTTSRAIAEEAVNMMLSKKKGRLIEHIDDKVNSLNYRLISTFIKDPKFTLPNRKLYIKEYSTLL